MIKINNLNKTYDRHSRNANTVLHNVSLTLPDTGFVCILGSSGCGKSTLLNTMSGLDDFDSGDIATENISVNKYGTDLFEAERNSNFGYIFQNYYLLSEHSVGYNVYLGMHCLDLSHDEKLIRVENALRAVNMERYFSRRVGELSGGQQQRVAIARALARKPRVIFADEPTGNLDEANTRNICALLKKISQTSLVIMVTHEENIASFFADRIIRLDRGRIISDSSTFKRGTLSDTGTIYTGDFKETTVEKDGLHVRYYSKSDSDGVDITVLALKDRVIIKLNDERMMSCTYPDEQPEVIYGERSEITPDEIRQADTEWLAESNGSVKPGKSLSLSEILREAVNINRSKRLRDIGTLLFLVLLTALTAFSVADFIALSKIDPHDFVTTHSQVLTLTLERGNEVDSGILGIQPLAMEFKSHLAQCGQNYDYAPDIPFSAEISGGVISQLDDLEISLSNFTYTPISFISEESIIMGSMPENSTEIVIDRWVIDAIMAQDGVAQNGITGMEYFIGKKVKFMKQTFSPTIVGICDSGEAAVYMDDEALAALTTGKVRVASLSSLQKAYPGVYDDVVLGENECMVLPANAGNAYYERLGGSYLTGDGLIYNIVQLVEETDFYADFVVADTQIDTILLSTSSHKFYVFCEDKQAMIKYLKDIPSKMENAVNVTVTDSYSSKMAAYKRASQLRMDARTIVTATVIILSLVMLYLLRRSQVLNNIETIAVYRLLGVPGSKTVSIFCMESLMTTLPVSAATLFAVWLIQWIPFLQLDLYLPWSAIAIVYGAIVLFHLLVTVVSLCRLLKLPPAQLASKVDF